MNNQEIFSHIDHTLLKPTASWPQIEKLCQEAIQYQTASVCIPPAYVKSVKQAYGNQITICTVIGFPSGYNTTACKCFEAEDAIQNGADEIDMVINQGSVKSGDFASIENEIRMLKEIVKDKILKVIIETCNLSDEEKIALCKAITNAGADYIKTSTGFGSSGAVIEDIELFKKHIGKNVKIKAAGGVKTRDDLFMFLEAGCDRIGTSSAVGILSGNIASSY